MNEKNTFHFQGFRRKDDTVGVRNYIGIIPTVFCANEVASRIAQIEKIAHPLLHHQGCVQLPSDIRQVTRVLIGLGSNPNLGGVLLVGLGCEGVPIDEVYAGIKKSGKPVEKIVIQERGMTKTAELGSNIVKDMANSILRYQREQIPLSDIVIGIKCGSSDFTSGLIANPIVGQVSDMIVENGGTVIFGETTELIGAEHIIAKRAKNDDVRDKILRVVKRLENKIEMAGVDLRGSQPTPGNIRGGLTTIEEKSLGAICKSGSKSIEDVLEYGVKPGRRGLFLMDSPGKESELLTGLAAAGATVVLFTTGGGAPQGYPIVPIIKIASNPKKCKIMTEHIDVDVSHFLGGDEAQFTTASQSIFKNLLDVSSGDKTRAEILGYNETVEIYITGFSI